jgi:hypothetical protein
MADTPAPIFVDIHPNEMNRHDDPDWERTIRCTEGAINATRAGIYAVVRIWNLLRGQRMFPHVRLQIEAEEPTGPGRVRFALASESDWSAWYACDDVSDMIRFLIPDIDLKHTRRALRRWLRGERGRAKVEAYIRNHPRRFRPDTLPVPRWVGKRWRDKNPDIRKRVQMHRMGMHWTGAVITTDHTPYRLRVRLMTAKQRRKMHSGSVRVAGYGCRVRVAKSVRVAVTATVAAAWVKSADEATP